MGFRCFLGESSKVGTIENLRISVGAAQMASDCHSQVWWMWEKNAMWSDLSPLIMVQWKMANYLKGNDPIWRQPIFHFPLLWEQG